MSRLAMGAAAVEPNPAFSTSTATAISAPWPVGSYGANAMKSEWSSPCGFCAVPVFPQGYRILPTLPAVNHRAYSQRDASRTTLKRPVLGTSTSPPRGLRCEPGASDPGTAGANRVCDSPAHNPGILYGGPVNPYFNRDPFGRR